MSGTVKEADLVQCFTEELAGLMESFSEKDNAGKQSMNQMLISDKKSFATAGIRVLAKAGTTPGARYLVHLLAEEKLLVAGLLDPAVSGVTEAGAAAKHAGATGFPLQASLEVALTRELQAPPDQDHTGQILRILDVLGAISAKAAWNSLQDELIACRDPFVRAKATFLIGRSTKNAAWLGRRMLDKDARVQASAVDALAELDPREATPLLKAALTSRSSRVAANAALGLYRFGDLETVRALRNMACHPDSLFRLSAYWAIGETGDPRFIPFLREQFKSAEGQAHLGVIRAMSQIRRREQALAAGGKVGIHVSEIEIQPDQRRHFSFILSGGNAGSVTSWRPLNFAVWENGALIEHYELKLPNNPAALIIGFVAARQMSTEDPLCQGVNASLQKCLAIKRAHDAWRIDRFGVEDQVPPNSLPPTEPSNLPYDDAVVTHELKMRHCFATDAEWLARVMSAPVPRDRASADALAAITRQCEAMSKHAGKRHLFLFLDKNAATFFSNPDNVNRLKILAKDENVTLHGISLVHSPECAALRDLCNLLPDGTFTDAAEGDIAEAVEQVYRRLLNQFELAYTLPAAPNPGSSVTLAVCGPGGAGQVEFSLSAS